MFATCILFHSKFCIICDAQYLSFKIFLMFVTQLYCTQHLTITFSYCSYIYKKVLSCIFKINKYIKNRNVIPVIIIEKCQMLSYHYQKKSYHYQIYHCLKVKPSFHEKLFQRQKNKLVMNLCPATFRSFVVQWSAKIASC